MCRSGVVLFHLLLATSLAEEVFIKDTEGSLKGKVLLTPRAGKKYYSFTSVPYAEPPVGPNRFKNPRLLTSKWIGTVDATKPAPSCMQNIIFVASVRNQTIGQEDCLYLNIYTPSLNSQKKLPVLVYIHGGGFRCGQPPPTEEAPSNFMEENVVLVTVHYRLGTLGFLSTEDESIPGNFGLKDQATAIKWLSLNVDKFGGDPSSITVFGESAGGASVHYLITSELSRDLLKGAIAESGVIDALWAFAPQGKSRKIAKKLGEIVGCDINNNFLECLQDVDPKKLTHAETDFLVWDFDPAVVYQPVVEVKNDGAFLTEDPRKIKVTKPLITGFVTGEGLFKTISLINQDESVVEYFVENIDEILPAIMFLEPNTPRLSDFIAVVKARYFKDLTDRKDTLNGLEDFYRDLFFIYPIFKTLQRHKGPLFGYIFQHRAEISHTSKMGRIHLDDHRPCHADEILSLFNYTSGFPGIKGREEDWLFSTRLVKYWVNFGIYQNPTPKNSKFKWDQYKKGKFLQINTKEDKMVPLRYDDVKEFWDKAFQIIQSPGKIKEEL